MSAVGGLLEALGADWAAEYRAEAAVWTVSHAGGLWFEVDGSGETLDGEPARAVAAALLDAVEDGVKGRVVVEVSAKVVRAGSNVGKSYPPPERPDRTWEPAPGLRVVVRRAP